MPRSRGKVDLWIGPIEVAIQTFGSLRVFGVNVGIKFVAAGYEAATNKRLTLTGQRGPIRVTHSGPTS